jgi:endoglucanase
MGKHGEQAQTHTCWARSQMRYILGTSTGKSYLIGYGPDQPKRPHHRQSACSISYQEPCARVNNGTCCVGESGTRCCNADAFMSDHPALFKVLGGLVGGPDQDDRFPDIRNDYQRSEV